jgi:signal transduction histidine kinase
LNRLGARRGADDAQANPFVTMAALVGCLLLIYSSTFGLGYLTGGLRGGADQRWIWLWVPMGLLGLLAAHWIFAWLLTRMLAQQLRPILAVLQRPGEAVCPPPVWPGWRMVGELTQAVNQFQAYRRRHAAEMAAMTAAISHDLQTPITRLRLRADLVTDPKLRAKLASDLDAVSSMLQEQLDFARSGHLREAQVPVELSTLVEAVAEGMLDLGHRVSVQGHIRQTYRVALRAVERVVQNLVSNAISFGGSAEIRMSETERGVTISVLDEGPGVPEELLEKVFEPFYRVEGSRNRSRGGSGLGLAIARNLARAHGGDIQLFNRPQGGLEVVFMLPASLQVGATVRVPQAAA